MVSGADEAGGASPTIAATAAGDISRLLAMSSTLSSFGNPLATLNARKARRDAGPHVPFAGPLKKPSAANLF